MKKVMTAVLAAAMCMGMGVAAMADSIQPRTSTCSECGGNTYKTINYSAWETTAEYDCIYGYGSHKDKEQFRTEEHVYTCTSCGNEESTTYTRNRIYCPYIME